MSISDPAAPPRPPLPTDGYNTHAPPARPPPPPTLDTTDDESEDLFQHAPTASQGPIMVRYSAVLERDGRRCQKVEGQNIIEPSKKGGQRGFIYLFPKK